MTQRKQMKDVEKRVMSRAEGWFFRLEHYSFDFEHVPEDKNIADVPSRIINKEAIGLSFSKGTGKPQELCAVVAKGNMINNVEQC